MISIYVVVEEPGEDDQIPIGECRFVIAPQIGDVILIDDGCDKFVADVRSVVHRGIPAGNEAEPSIQLAATRRYTGELN